jgi:hypothetical protein
MEKITQEQYLEALKVIKAYEKQCAEDKLKIYEGCTEKDIVRTESINLINSNKEFHFWITKNNKNLSDGSNGYITYDHRCDFYTLERSHVPYKTYEEAYKNLIKGFKRKGIIK